MKDKIKKILNSELRYIYLVSIISADSNYDEESIQENIQRLTDIKESLDDEVNNVEEIVNFVNDGLVILNRDLAEYKNS